MHHNTGAVTCGDRRRNLRKGHRAHILCTQCTTFQYVVNASRKFYGELMRVVASITACALERANGVYLHRRILGINSDPPFSVGALLIAESNDFAAVDKGSDLVVDLNDNFFIVFDQ